LSGLINEEVSFQALDKKLSARHLKFIKTLVNQAMLKSKPFDSFNELNSLKKFNRVIVEDSTCVKLSRNLYEHFSGVSNGLSKVTNARIQVSLDLKKCCFEHVALTTYSQNDASILHFQIIF